MAAKPINLFIDAGNSRIKWAFDDGHYWQSGVSDRAQLGENLTQACPANKTVKRVLASSTRNQQFNSHLSTLVNDLLDCPVKFVVPKRRLLGVLNRYLPTRSLGSDRWAALLAMRSITKTASIVIDCGTAVTVDALTEGGIFAGGVIMPGLQLGLNSLAQTDNLDLANVTKLSAFGRSSEQAIYSGVNYAVAGGIERVIAQMRQTLGASITIYVTGGDAMTIKKIVDHDLIHEPELVLKGLKLIAEQVK